MKYEIFDGTRIPKIGFGTWKIGGGSYANPSQDARSLAALRSALELGYIHFDTAEIYASGHTEGLLGQVIRESGIPRETLFITSKVEPSNLCYKDMLDACTNSLRRLKTDYLDLYQIALAWLISQPRVIAIPMSLNPQHQAENLAAAEIELSAEEVEQLNRLA